MTKVVTGYLRATKVTIFVARDRKGFIKKIENIGLFLYIIKGDVDEWHLTKVRGRKGAIRIINHQWTNQGKA